MKTTRMNVLCLAALAAAVLVQPVAAEPGESAEKKELSATDMVLLYSGATQSSSWTVNRIRDYIAYMDRNGNEHWLFDGFLFLEIRDIGPGSSEVAFDPGHKNTDGTVLPAATQADWLKLVNYYFSDDHAIDAIEQAVEETARTLGEPPTPRQIVISIPNPIEYKHPLAKTGGTTYWGVLDGHVTDFSKDDDRFKACKWYIDRVLETYAKKTYKYVELAGFYWLTEETPEKSPLVSAVASYVAGKGYPLCWIPYFRAPGYSAWREKGFERAYYQPNYFFDSQVPYERLRTACDEAATYRMDLEMEFDETALARYGKGNRLRDYMEVFREVGPWARSRLAYYQSSEALRTLKCSNDPQDRNLYYDFCDFVVTRPFRTQAEPTK